MPSRLAPMEHEPVEATPRKAPTLQEQVAVLRRQASCHMCGAAFEGGRLEYDHTRPLELGGQHNVDNLKALCPNCHRRKTDSDLGAIAKARRLRGLTGQQARRKRNGSKLKGPGFPKHLTKGLDGKVRRRNK